MNHAGDGALGSLKGMSPDLIADDDSVGNVDVGVDNLCGVEDLNTPGVVLVGFK